ncbi:hypothetical protein ACGFIU_18765 [Rhodococcus oryzae]|uniref:hypothetical protein n=1 Tax=Rhodococcus oryzae TaxID=2571143 RepID=UPI003723B67E
MSSEIEEDDDTSGWKTLDDKPTPDGSDYVYEAFERVSEIGKGDRWYDLPYRVLSWLLFAWPRQILPQRAREILNSGRIFLTPFNTHDRHKVWSLDDRSRNVFVPEEEHVTVPGLWVVELFPPSEFASLEASIEANSWDSKRSYPQDLAGNQEMLARSRAGAGWNWWRLAEIYAPTTKQLSVYGVREKLPAEFTAVELRAVQIGTGLTAVVARFDLTKDAAKSIDTVWHTRHEPQLVYDEGRLRAEDRKWATFRVTQEARESLHNAARKWIADRCPGFFVSNDEPQLLMDMLLFDKHDPIPGERTDREFSDALRALGLTGHEAVHRTSPDIPQLLLSPVEGLLSPALDRKRTWALWGNLGIVASSINHLGMRNSASDRAVAHAVDDRMRNFLVALAVSDFLTLMEAKYAELRDSAHTRHGTFKAKGLKRLRASFLTLSLDLTSVARDVDSFWSREWRYAGEARFTRDYAPWIVARDENSGSKRFPPIDMNDEMRKTQRQQLKHLIGLDRDYRDILATVASLGASVDAFKIGRVALWIAFASMATALVTLLITQPGNHTTLGNLLSWIRGLFPS